MLREMVKLWRDNRLMTEVIERLVQMVQDDEYVFVHGWEVFRGQAIAEQTRGVLKEHDRAVNRNEREIRRLLVEHLSINPGKDASGCLAVMLMAKDAERLGDHSRNIFELAARGEGQTQGMTLFDDIDGVCAKVSAVFTPLRAAIGTSNEETAHHVLADYQEIKGRLKALQKRLFSEDLHGWNAVASTLCVRYLMRINAHMGNIATGIIFPIQNIDYVSRGLKEEHGER